MASQKPRTIEDLPVAITPRYRTAEPNAPILLYDGDAVVSIKGEIATKRVEVRFVWLPSPRVDIRILDCFTHGLFGDEIVCVSLKGHRDPLQVLWTSAHLSGGPAAAPPSIVGQVEGDGLNGATDFRSILFHVANGPQYHGAAVRDATGTRGFMGRAVLTTAPWRVALDAAPELFIGDKREEVEASGGYAITHVGVLDRQDGSTFREADAEPVLEAFGWLLSFCRGAWTFPVLLVGTGPTDSPPGEAWRPALIDAAQYRQSWFNRLSGEGFCVFDGLSKRFADELWGEPIKLALHWYVVCNNLSNTSIEGAIVLQQAAFELLAWTRLVEDRKVLSEDGAQKLPASDKLRLLLSECGIPLPIPVHLKALIAVAREYDWRDGPRATTEMRNALVHANPAKRDRVLGKGADHLVDTWTLGQWYLELMLLRLFGYEGRYSNRLRRGVLKGQEIEPVPWAIAAEPAETKPMTETPPPDPPAGPADRR